MCFVKVTWFEETNHTFNFDDGFVKVKCFEEIDHTFEDDPRVTTIPCMTNGHGIIKTKNTHIR